MTELEFPAVRKSERDADLCRSVQIRVPLCFRCFPSLDLLLRRAHLYLHEAALGAYALDPDLRPRVRINDAPLRI
jgi:hypothetical protein